MFEEKTAFFESVGQRRTFCGLFGKHPAWNDHMVGFGLESPTLQAFRRAVYTDGIGSAIDSGVWAQGADGPKRKDWNHKVLIHHPEGLVLARLTQSVDRAGRREYPLVSVLHVASGLLPGSLEVLWEQFESLHKDVADLKDQDLVKERWLEFPYQIEEAMRRLNPLPEVGPGLQKRHVFLGSDGFGEQEIGLERFLYQLAVELPDFVPGKKGNDKEVVFRVPLLDDMGEDGLLTYLSLFRTQIGKKFPVTLVVGEGGDWLDIAVGIMPKTQIERMRQGLNIHGLLTEVEFHIPDAMAGKIRDVMGVFSSEPVAEVVVIADPNAREKGTSFFASFVNKLSPGRKS